MAKIIISRKSEIKQRIRRFKVLIDGEVAGEVTSTNPGEYHVQQGKHIIQCKTGWFSSEPYEVTLGENDVKVLNVTVNLPYFSIVYLVLIAAVLLPFFKRISSGTRDLPEGWDWARAIAIFVVASYYLWFFVVKRKSYLRVVEDTKNIFNS